MEISEVPTGGVCFFSLNTSQEALLQMSTGDPFFKIRPTKRSNPEARTTLDSIHHAHLNKLLDESKNLDDLERDFRELKEKLQACGDDIEKVKIEKEDAL